MDKIYIRLVGILHTTSLSHDRIKAMFARGDSSPIQFLEGWVDRDIVQKNILTIPVKYDDILDSVRIPIRISNSGPVNHTSIDIDPNDTEDIGIIIYPLEVLTVLQLALTDPEIPSRTEGKFPDDITSKIIEYLLNN